VGNPCKLQLDSAGFILCITIMLAATHSILTRCWLYSPQGFPLPLITIFVSYSTATHHGYTTTFAREERIDYWPIGGRFIEHTHSSDTTTVKTDVCWMRRQWQCSHQTYDPGCIFQNCQHDWKQLKYEAACSWMWVYLYWGKQRSINHIMNSGCP